MTLNFNLIDFPRLRPGKTYWRSCLECAGEGIKIGEDRYAYHCMNCGGVGKLDLPIPKAVRRAV